MDNAALSTTVRLRDGRKVVLRPLGEGDVHLLGDLFCGLSEQTRSMYGPHPFNRETAAKLCAAVGDERTVRFVAVLGEGTPEAEMIAYMILSREIWPNDRKRYGATVPWDTTACLAPVVADAYQGQGLGSVMGEHVLACARTLGLSHVILMGGVLDENPRAKRLYQKLGFKQVRSFWTGAGSKRRFNHDMVVEL